MSSPSPFEIAQGVGNRVGDLQRENRDVTSLDDIIAKTDAASKNNPQDFNNLMSQVTAQISANISPQNQAMAQQIIQKKVQQHQKEKQANVYKEQGFPEGFEDLPENIQKEFIKNSAAQKAAEQKQEKINPKVQDWAYKQLDKKPSIQALNNSLAELKKLNSSGVTGPIAGRSPSAIANTDADAIRKAIDANAIQILNVHKSMFPRGLTQGEFKTLSQKLVSSTNTQQANEQIINAYEKLAKMQTNKIRIIEETVNKYGFDPMLPFIVSGIEREFEKKEAQENRALYKMITGEEPEKDEGFSEENIDISNKRLSLEEIFNNG